MNTYYYQTEIRLTVDFTAITEIPGPADPTNVAVTITRPDGTLVDGSIVRDGVGTYHCDIAADQVGVWQYRWQGSGALLVASPTGLFRVD